MLLQPLSATSATLPATNHPTALSVQRTEVEKDVVEEKEVAVEATVVEKVVEAEETTVAKAVGSLEVVREASILTTHVYVIVVVKLATRHRIAHMRKNLRKCWKSAKMAEVQIKVQKEQRGAKMTMPKMSVNIRS